MISTPAAIAAGLSDGARRGLLMEGAVLKSLDKITIALGLKAVFLVTTILGITGLWPAILADMHRDLRRLVGDTSHEEQLRCACQGS